MAELGIGFVKSERVADDIFNAIVVPVDVNNLPEDDVIAFNPFQAQVAKLESSNRGVYCSARESLISGITHYMEIPKL